MALLTHAFFPAGHRRWVFLLLWWGIGAGGIAAPGDTPREYRVKAVFLFNFAQFVEWPAAAFPGPDSPLVVGVLGDDPFGAELDAVVRNESVGTHPLEVRRFRTAEEVGACHILFISASESARLDAILDALRARPILTVGEAEGFAQRGVMIRFLTDRGRIRLRVNLESARVAGLRLSSKLLRHAEIVSEKAAP
jgi:hypothetical protein